ncbi:MAG: 50S ribosomal protein L18 [Crocinitomicaceae bacterium]|jgi:large subunit ribosomal protein L18|nr:50S ribosomal protein L18 [Crocinitomicaceae bacterium]MBP6033213.1 50S ribosomal protein L18 [Crocinitomicaceae bacterium]
MALNKVLRRAKIKRRIRKKVFGTTAIPRLTVFRSNKQIYAQLVDDISGKTLASAGSLKMEDAQKTNKVNQASIVGKKIAEVAAQAGIEKVVFDRNGYLYHGRIKSLADSAREGGLKF